MSFRLLVYLIAFLLISCEPPVTFEEPQPAGASALKHFPNKLLGTYRSLEDNATLEITKNHIIRTYNEKLHLHKAELDSGLVLQGNFLIETGTGNKYKAKVNGDSIIAFFNASETVFSLSPENILTKQKGQYFLNTKFEPNKWGVQKMAFHVNLLSINSFLQKADLAKLRHIAVSEIDSAQKFKPTRKQFKEFVKMNGFGNEELFLKIR